MPKLRPISIGESEKIQLDEDNRLYWDGKPIVTKEELVFQKRINWAIYLTAFSTAVYALVEVLKLFGFEFCLSIRRGTLLMYVNPKVINSIGLIFDIAGAIMIWKFIPIFWEENESGDLMPTDPEEDKKKVNLSKVGIFLIGIGFVFQLISNWL